jgi:hypothetical protein
MRSVHNNNNKKTQQHCATPSSSAAAPPPLPLPPHLAHAALDDDVDGLQAQRLGGAAVRAKHRLRLARPARARPPMAGRRRCVVGFYLLVSGV